MADLIISVELLRAPEDEFYLSFDDIDEVIQKKLKLKPQEDLEGLQPAHRRYEIAIKSYVIWQDKNIENFLNRKFNLSSNKLVEISRSNEATTTVRVVRMPMDWEEDRVMRIFSWYGDIKKVEKEQWRAGSDVKAVYAGVWNGSWRLKMILNSTRPLPSTLSVSGKRFEIYHPGQVRTC